MGSLVKEFITTRTINYIQMENGFVLYNDMTIKKSDTNALVSVNNKYGLSTEETLKQVMKTGINEVPKIIIIPEIGEVTPYVMSDAKYNKLLKGDIELSSALTRFSMRVYNNPDEYKFVLLSGINLYSCFNYEPIVYPILSY